LYCDTTNSLQGDEFWSFHRLVQGDHKLIHMNWGTNYNTDYIKHLAFLLNGEKTWAYWGAICLKTSVMLLVT
jgi:hypothetical protein